MAKRSVQATPFDWWLLGWQTTLMMAEAQAVVTMRMMGMAGGWAVAPGEDQRMVSEKPLAFARSAQAAGLAMMTGQRPDQIATAALRPLRSKTRSNARRLTRRGPGPRK